MPINKYPGTCHRCGGRVEAGQGIANLAQAGGWLIECRGPCERRQRPPAVVSRVGDVAGIHALFDRASRFIKRPIITLGVDMIDGGVRISVGSDAARFPGTLTILAETQRRADDGRRVWLGRIHGDGRVEPSSRLPVDQQRSLLERLKEFAAEPARVAGEHGRLTSRCCFCRIRLKDERSVSVGYGETCADNFGLPWGSAEPVRQLLAGEVARAAGRAVEQAHPFGYRSEDNAP